MKEMTSLAEDMLLEYMAKSKMLDKLYLRTNALEDSLEALDDDIEEAEETGLDEVVEALCEARNAINLQKLELKIKMHELGLWLAKFEKIRQMTR